MRRCPTERRAYVAAVTVAVTEDLRVEVADDGIAGASLRRRGRRARFVRTSSEPSSATG
jgi:hypothetical protein